MSSTNVASTKGMGESAVGAARITTSSGCSMSSVINNLFWSCAMSSSAAPITPLFAATLDGLDMGGAEAKANAAAPAPTKGTEKRGSPRENTSSEHLASGSHRRRYDGDDAGSA